MAKRATVLTIALIALTWLLVACGGEDGSAGVEATAAALRTQLAQELPTEAPTFTPEPAAAGPTAEPAQGSEQPPSVATAAAVATQRSDTATAEAIAAQQAAEQAAQVAEATKEPIRADIQQYGLDPNQGEVAWVHRPMTIFVDGYLQYDWKNEHLLTVARDFVLSADITWITDFGTTGCGFAVRSDGNEEDPSQYLIVATRGGSGHVLFAVQREGDVDLFNEVEDIYANGIDPLFEWQNNTTNRIAIVGIGDTFTIYSNGTRLGQLNGGANFLEGFVAFLALNESGTTSCTFENGWLWQIN